MKYSRNYEKKQAILRELRNYRGNKLLFKKYKNIIEHGENNSMNYNLERCRKDLIRVECNIKFVLNMIQAVPQENRELILDVFIRDNLTQEEILDKHDLTVALLHYYTDKVATKLADMDIV